MIMQGDEPRRREDGDGSDRPRADVLSDSSDDDDAVLLTDPLPATACRKSRAVAGAHLDLRAADDSDDDVLILDPAQLCRTDKRTNAAPCQGSLPPDVPPSQAARGTTSGGRDASESTADPRRSPLPRSPSSAEQLTPVLPPAAPQPGVRPSFLVSNEQSSIGPLELAPSVQVPAAINRYLRDYQREGVRFFYACYRNDRGCILGDDMGLGKTIQVIAFLAAIMGKLGWEEKDDLRRISAMRQGHISAGKQKANAVWPTCLIVCPASVMGNWHNELETWGYFEHAQLSRDTLTDFGRGRLDILIASHELASQWVEELKEVDFSVVVIDECHKLKNPRTAMTQAFGTLPCPCRIGLSGTTIQNHFDELWTVLDWCSSQKFGTLKYWREEVSEPIRAGQALNAKGSSLAAARIAADRLVNKFLPPYFLRRTKDLIKAQLPIKRDNIVFCPLTPTQVAVYKQILDEPEARKLRSAYEPCECGAVDEERRPYKRVKCCHTETEDGLPWNHYLFKYMTLLQKCSNHVALVFPDSHDNIDISDKSPQSDLDRKARFDRQTDIVKRLFPDDWPTKQSNKRNGFLREYCGKWLILRDLMRTWKEQGDKLLLFSMNLRLLDWLALFIEVEGFNHVRLDGSTVQKKRQALVDEFNRDQSIFCFLISTTAGGAGLNLTGANRVVIFDPHWNPANDLQATDRAYRFGQTRNVDVYRLIARGSLEEVIYDRQLYKQQLGRIGYEASHERRFFKLGDEKGIERLLELRERDHVTRDLIETCDMFEAAAAARPLASQLKGKDKRGAGGAQQAAARGHREELVEDAIAELDHDGVEGPKASTPLDPIQALLTRQGVRYTHRNDHLLGGSTAEAAISRRAIERHAPDIGAGADADGNADGSLHTQGPTSKRRRTVGGKQQAASDRGDKPRTARTSSGTNNESRPWPPVRKRRN